MIKLEPVDLQIFDAHCHFGSWGPSEHAGRTIDPFAGYQINSEEMLLKRLQNAGVSKAVVVPVYSLDPHSAFSFNAPLLDISQHHSDLIIPGLWVDPSPEVSPLLNQTLKMAVEGGVRVLKTSPAAWNGSFTPDPSTWDNRVTHGLNTIADYLRSVGGIFQIHTGSDKSDVQLIELLFRRLGKGIVYHLVHMGLNVAGHFYLIPRIKQWITEGFEIVIDTSCSFGFAVRWLVYQAELDPIIASRILYASDEPWGMHESELAKVIYAIKSNKQLGDDILWNNAFRIYQTVGHKT